MIKSYTTVQSHAKFTFEDRKSIFIAHCSPCKTESEAIDFINNVKKAYPDARHHVYAYSLLENSIARYSDDREPQGTAGMPVLDVIRKNGCVNTVIVVVRYFGGVLLGTGGLVHAYGQSALGALKAANIITYDTYTRLSVSVDYSDYQKILPIFSEFDFLASDTEYTQNVKALGTVLSSNLNNFLEKITNITGGKAKTQLFDEIFDFRK